MQFDPLVENPDGPSRFAVVAARLSPLWTLLMMVGMYCAGFGWRPGAYLLLAALLCILLGHLVTGLTEYRRVMRRPWPKVTPLNDDDDWW